MVPTEFMAAAVAMLTDALPQLLYLDNKFFTCHLVKVGDHNVVPQKRIQSVQRLVPRDRMA
jgi:hypothetical protein